MILFSRSWWAAAGARAANTAIAALLPLVMLLVAGSATPAHVLDLVAIQVILSLATSLAGLPELGGKTTPLWQAILTRSAKTLGQSLGTALVGVELLSAIDWSAAWVLIAGATLTTILRTLHDYLPETPLVVGSLSVSTATVRAVPPAPHHP